MADKQHIYEGEGNPFDLGIHAPVGSHYIDKTRTDHVWFSMFHDPEEPYTEWVKLETVYPPLASDSGGWSVPLPYLGRAQGVLMNGGVFTLSGEGVVFSNVELVPVPGGVTYSSATPFMFLFEGTEDGKGVLTITQVHTYSFSGG